jgi:SpoVK/Ycf46/Vps4 family AAA+-type ATPase
MEYLMRDLEVHKSKICVEGQDREKGWLLIGTPGSGKSLISKYIAYTMGFPAISFNISSIMNSLVGQTEKNMHAFCQVVEAFAPVVLYIDEFDKALSSGQELDGGTMTRALGILFSWLNDTNAPVFLLASANNLDPNMGFALTRRGRFSQLYWVGEPCRKARYQILQFAFRKRNFDVEERLIEELADKTLYFSGADLVWLVNESIAFANYYNDDPFSFRNRVLALVEENRPRVLIMKKRYDTLREWAEAYCRPAGPKPEE